MKAGLFPWTTLRFTLATQGGQPLKQNSDQPNKPQLASVKHSSLASPNLNHYGKGHFTTNQQGKLLFDIDNDKRLKDSHSARAIAKWIIHQWMRYGVCDDTDTYIKLKTKYSLPQISRAIKLLHDTKWIYKRTFRVGKRKTLRRIYIPHWIREKYFTEQYIRGTIFGKPKGDIF